jgi:hypothetical protein
MSESKSTREWVPLDRLVRAAGLQMRADLPDGFSDPATVERYYEAILDGDAFPPLEAVFDGERYWLFDGFQRAAALERAGRGSAECLVFPGTYQDAVLRALSANSLHGLTRTPNDCRRAINALLDSSELLDRVLARGEGGVHRILASTCGVSKSLVVKVLEQRQLRVLGGKLVSKRVMNSSAREAASPEAQTAPRQEVASTEMESREQDASSAAPPTHPPSPKPDTGRELDAACSAVESLRTACRKLLDGPLASHLLRIAAHHRIPFSRAGSPECLLALEPLGEAASAIAWWEPLAKIEAVFADLSAAGCSGLDGGD